MSSPSRSHSSLLPHQLPPRAIDEFQVLWKKHYKEDLPREVAADHAHRLLALLQILTEPDTAHQEPPAPNQSPTTDHRLSNTPNAHLSKP